MNMRTVTPLLALLLLGACGGTELRSLIPGASVKEQDVTRAPQGATGYVCDGGKRLFVRYLDNGDAAWVILPEREFRLNKTVAASGVRYSNGSATLDTKGNEAVLTDAPTVNYTGCKLVAK